MQVISLRDYRNEEFWNVLTHLLGVIMSIIGIPFLFYFNSDITTLSTISVILFSLGLLLVYSSSSVYHYVINTKVKKRLQVIDHISIYSVSYTHLTLPTKRIV